jgi:hypothetical protein
MSDFAVTTALEVLAESRNVKELEFVNVAGEPAYLATLTGRITRMIPPTGSPKVEFDGQWLLNAIARAVEPGRLAEMRLLDQYDRYYLDRGRALPLPVILVSLNDAEHSRYYIDPKTARIVGSYSSQNWISRWLYHGLHSLSFPWLYTHRPLWDLVVITFMLGGTALSATSALLAWRVARRKLERAFP